MPTPLGPVPPDPNDPDLWDWDSEFTPPRHRVRRLTVILMVLAVTALLVVSVR